MSAGKLSLTNGSSSVTGDGTAFNTELSAGDFVVVVVGGVPYTLPVESVESATSLVLVSVYTGPTQSDAAWYAVARTTLNMVTAALVAQSAEALRGLNYDKQNWQQLFSGTGTITVKLPDESTYSGPSWGGITKDISDVGKEVSNVKKDLSGTNKVLEGKAGSGENNDITALKGLKTALSLNQGGTGATDADGAREALGLGSVATRNVGTGKQDIPDMSFQNVGLGNMTGWQKFPNGLIRQWGVTPPVSGSGSSVTVPFPIAFPNSCLQMKMYPVSDGVPAATLFMAGTTTKTTATVWAVARITASGPSLSGVTNGSTSLWEAWGN